MEAENFEAANVVMVTSMTEPVNLKTLYRILPITYTNFIFGSKNENSKIRNSRVRIPYFGVENIIVSIRYNNMSRGVRNTGGQLKNVASIDLQHCEKNIHLKISESKIQLSGALSGLMGDSAFRTVIKHMEMGSNNWKHVKSLPKNILDNTILHLKNTLDRELKDGDIYGDMEIVSKSLGNNELKIDNQCAMYLSAFAHEYNCWEEFKGKIDEILSVEDPIYDKIPDIERSTIHNAVYHYEIGHTVSMIRLAKGLNQLGYGVSYHNWWKPKQMSVMVPIYDKYNRPADISEFSHNGTYYPGLEVNKNLIEKAADGIEPGSPYEEEVKSPNYLVAKPDKISAHRFTLYQKGTIRQSSPSIHEDALKVRNRLLNDIHEIVDSYKDQLIDGRLVSKV